MRVARTARATTDYEAATGRIAGLPFRRHHVLLVAWTVLWFFLVEPSGGFSWHYLRQGEQLLFSGQPDGGLSLYARHPELQIGPVSLAAARLTAPFSPHTGQLVAEAASAALGLVMLVVVGRTAALYYLGTGTNHRRLQQRLLIAGLAFIPMWVEVSVRFAHLDDVLALFFTTLAAHALARGKPVQVAVFLALAVDSKPWAVAFAPLILALPRPAWLRTALWFALLVAVAWLPFYLGNLDTMAAAKFTIPNQPASALRWFGVTDPATPWWDRPTQFALGIGLGSIAVWRGRWPAVVLLGADARILLDPSVYTYYTASILLGTLLWDAVGQKRLVPWWSWIALAALYGGTLLLPSDAARGFARLAFVVVSAAYVLFWPTQQPRRPRATGQGDGGRRSARRRERVLVGAGS
ncbi:hypothetical protein [Streptomyces sp. 1331.2]|uniref:hypothetical protein n=1 Tax=Streptomyces sp. 1331.2 TaxID=1938835 RepID=UPI000BC76716|nr:hypothetical protein SAMN06272789_3227 [Streptomyces sp. 1331.2]